MNTKKLSDDHSNGTNELMETLSSIEENQKEHIRNLKQSLIYLNGALHLPSNELTRLEDDR